MNITFLTFSIFFLLFALFAISSTNIVYSVLSLILVFCNSAVLLLSFEIEFISILLIIIYVGAIAVLFLFIVMMLNIKPGASFRFNNLFMILILANCGFFVEYFSILIDTNVHLNIRGIDPFFGSPWINLIDPLSNVELVGQIIYTFYAPFFVLAGLILLIALIGAVMLTLKKGPRQFVFKQMSRNYKKAFFVIKNK